MGSTELELVKIIMEEEKDLGANDFLIGGDLNSELLKLETDGTGLNSKGVRPLNEL